MNYFNHYKMEVEGTYIISIQGNELSKKLTHQCLDSCEKVGQPNVRLFPAFDATDSPIEQQDYDVGKPIGELGSIKIPDMIKDQSFINFLRLRRSDLLMTQIACFLSHYSLWCRCLELDKPIVILEHDAVMLKPYLKHQYYNNIVYLGGIEQVEGNFHSNTPIPPHASDQKGLDRFISVSYTHLTLPTILLV